jgi:hypothetical protein
MSTKKGLDHIRNRYFRLRKPRFTREQYTNFIREANMLIRNFIIDGGMFELPHGLGRIYIERYLPTIKIDYIDGKPIPRGYITDYGETDKLRKQLQPTWSRTDWLSVPLTERPFIMYTNEHTDGYSFHVKWDKKNCVKKNKGLKYYCFYPTDEFKRALARRIKKENRPAYYDKPPIRKSRDDNRES